MENIKAFTGHPQYYSAVGIIRTKIVGTVADVLSNHTAEINFCSIINKMCAIRRNEKQVSRKKESIRKPLWINKAHNIELLKQKCHISKTMKPWRLANQEAVRKFIMGLNSRFTSWTLYSRNPSDLEHAYAIASTIYHDNNNHQFEMQPNRNVQRTLPLTKWTPQIQSMDTCATKHLSITRSWK